MDLICGKEDPPVASRAEGLCWRWWGRHVYQHMAKDWARAFYRSPVWQALRRRALIRDGFTCRFCGARAEEVDHIQELTPANINDPSVALNMNNLQSLCHDCHTRKTMEDKGVLQTDCDAEYYFDADGNLSPRGS